MAKGQGRSSGQGVKLLVIRDYLRSHTDKSHCKNATEIKRYLATQGIEASEKTIYNDLTLLKYDFKEPIEYSAKNRGYYITEPQFEPKELRLMVDSVQASKFITQRDAEKITNKIKGLADIYTKETLRRTSYVRGRGMNENVIGNADIIHQAIAEDKQISFRYFHYSPNKSKRYSKSGNNYVVSPFALHWENGNYYLYAYVKDGEKFMSFRIDRMDEMEKCLLSKREGKDQYRKTALTSTKQAKVFSMYHGDIYTIRMRFSNRLAGAVIDEFGKDTMLIPVDEKHFTFLADVEISPPFFAWVATFGRGAKILGPEPVVEKMKEFLQKSMEMYENDGEK